TNEGIGSLKAGMTAVQARDAGWIERGATGCNSGWVTRRYPKSVYAGVWDDTVKVVSTKSSKFATRKGVRVGDSRARLLRKYPSARIVNRNIYDDSPIYAPQGSRLHFTVHKGKVVMIEVVDGFLPDGTEFEC
nr:hypothetical protein [Candidatus Nanopelagicales bacterium]